MDIFNLLFTDLFEEITKPSSLDYCLFVSNKYVSFLGYFTKHSISNNIMTFNNLIGINYISANKLSKNLFRLKRGFTHDDIFDHIQQWATAPLEEPMCLIFWDAYYLNFAWGNDHARLHNIVNFESGMDLNKIIHNGQRVLFTFNQSYILK